MSQPYPPVVIVDEYDTEIGVAPLAQVWKKGQYHRIVSVFIQDDHGRMLLQLRSPQVSVYPDSWDQAAGGHVDEGFTYEQTAANEAHEELGLDNLTLVRLGTFKSNNTLDDGRIINQFERVFMAQVPHDTPLKPQAEEVSKLQWFTRQELQKAITQNPQDFTPGLLHILRTYFEFS